MSEEATNDIEVSSNPSGPVISTKRETTEVLDGNGRNIGGGDSALGKIFDKISEGADAKSAVKEVMKEETKETKSLFDNQDEGNAKPKEVESVAKTEPAPEAVVEKKVAAPVKAEPVAEEVVDEADLQVLPHDKPKTAVRISALLKKSALAQEMAENTKKELAEKATKLKELEEELNKIRSIDPLTNDKVKEHLDELQMYRRRYELENSDEVKSKFDGRVNNAEETIHKTLAAHGLPESLINEIKAEGGWLKFIDSNRVIGLAKGDMSAADIAETIKKSLPSSERRRLEALELEQIQTKREKDSYFSEETKKASDYFANRESQTKAQQAEAKKQFDTAVQTVREWREKFKKENEWLNEKAIDAGVSAEQRKQLEEHNAHAKQLNSVIEKHLAAKDVNGMLDVLVDSIKYHQERRNLASALADNQKLKNDLKAKQDELDKFKRAGGSVSKNGSLAGGGGSRTDEQKAPVAPPSLEDAFDRMAAGKSLDNS